jgi:ribose 5-phosphate isomerase B
MKVAVASDHRGFRLKKIISRYLQDKDNEVIDFGTYSCESCDYPDYIYPATKAVKDGRADRAIVICYSGVGSSIIANRLPGIRAALVFNIKMAALSRKHNDSNVLVLAAGFTKYSYAKKIVSRWLKTAFEGGRHSRRLKKIKDFEKKIIKGS